MQKYFVSEEELAKNIITGDDAFHIKSVIRNRIGDKIIVSDEKKTFLVAITNITDKLVTYEIVEEKIGNVELPVFISIFQGYPKGDKMDEIIKHGTELGASQFYPTIMKRSVFKLDPKKKDQKLVRFNKIAKEAAEQSYRSYIPEVVDILNLKQIDFSNFDYKVLCFEESAKNGESSNFKRIVNSLKPGDKVAILIGPEGGVDESEVSYLKSQGFECCALGPRILRTETAVFYCLSAISYEMELK